MSHSSCTPPSGASLFLLRKTHENAHPAFIKTCVTGLVLSVTSILRATLTKFGVYVRMCNYFSQTTEPICIKIIPANRASNADCYRLLRFEILPKPYLQTPKIHFWGPVMLNQWEIDDCCKVHSKINRKMFTIYGSNDVVQPKDGPFWG